MAGEMRSEREYSMLQYLSYLLVPFHPLFSERGAQKVERPKADWEVRHLSLPVYLKANFRFRTTREQRSTKKSILHSANAYEQQAPDVEVHTDFSIAMQSCNSNLRRTSTASFHLLYDPWVSLLTTMVTLLTTDPGRDRWTVKLSNLKNVHYSRDSLILWPLSNSASFKKGQKKANWFIDSTRE